MSDSQLVLQHHQLFLDFDVSANRVHYIDSIMFNSIGIKDDHLYFYLGNQFTVKQVRVEENALEFSSESFNDYVTCYKIFSSEVNGNITIEVEGILSEFTWKKVSIIEPNLIELSGFIHWFPTFEEMCYLEEFTYTIDSNIPFSGPFFAPGTITTKEKRYFIEQKEKSADIFIFASPIVKKHLVKTSTKDLVYYLPPYSQEEVDSLIKDYQAIVTIGEKYLGPFPTESEGIAIISPRKPGGAEWGYKRGFYTITGDGFAQYMLKNDWLVRGLKKSLAAHETIHFWLGEKLGFIEMWLCESLTQYCEVIFTSERFDTPSIANQYFSWYHKRLQEEPRVKTHAVTDLSINENHYNLWYLKGSWAYWDLEHEVGRGNLLLGVKKIIEKNQGTNISYHDFCDELGTHLGVDVKNFLDHWYNNKDFAPIYRKDHI